MLGDEGAATVDFRATVTHSGLKAHFCAEINKQCLTRQNGRLPLHPCGERSQAHHKLTNRYLGLFLHLHCDERVKERDFRSHLRIAFRKERNVTRKRVRPIRTLRGTKNIGRPYNLLRTFPDEPRSYGGIGFRLDSPSIPFQDAGKISVYRAGDFP